MKPENVPASVHDRLLKIARESHRPFNELLQYYAIERFLYRMAQSKYTNQFILKGGVLFRIWNLQGFRPTRDIDLLGYTENSTDNLTRLVQEICRQEVEPDGVIFDATSVRSERIRENADYEGVRVRMDGTLGKVRIHLQLDVGFADVVFPLPQSIQIPCMISSPSTQLRVYPPCAVVAEKLQAMVFLGSINSRMKDFYDIWLMARQLDFDGHTLQESIRKTFSHRNTSIPTEEPVFLSEDFVRLKSTQWRAFLRNIDPFEEEIPFVDVLKCIQQFVMPVFLERDMRKKWRPGGPWE